MAENRNPLALYASPSLRWGLLLEDHPEAHVTFDCRLGTELGIPSAMGGDEQFVVATIHFPPGTGKPDAIGYKPLSAGTKRSGDHDSDVWNVLCTKALGRALKRAGYPDNLNDLKALVLWRQRDAEINAIRAGTANLALTAAPIEKALEAAASRSAEGDSPDDRDAPDEIAEVEIVEDEPEPAKPNTVEKMRHALSKLGPKSKDVTAWARRQGWRVTSPKSEDEAQAILAYALRMQGVNPETGEAVDVNEEAGMLAELIGGLDETERKNFAAYCKMVDIDPNMAENDPTSLTPAQRAELLGWLDPDGDDEG
jgi:hypothetical protein